MLSLQSKTRDVSAVRRRACRSRTATTAWTPRSRPSLTWLRRTSGSPRCLPIRRTQPYATCFAQSCGMVRHGEARAALRAWRWSSEDICKAHAAARGMVMQCSPMSAFSTAIRTIHAQTMVYGKQALLRVRRDFQGQGLGIIVWAFAKIGYDPSKIRDLLQAFAQEVCTAPSRTVPLHGEQVCNRDPQNSARAGISATAPDSQSQRLIRTISCRVNTHSAVAADGCAHLLSQVAQYLSSTSQGKGIAHASEPSSSKHRASSMFGRRRIGSGAHTAPRRAASSSGRSR